MNPWILTYKNFEIDKVGLRESLCTLGNGYFATRGAAEEAYADGLHYPGTYIAGAYNALETTIANRSLLNEDLVNFPNWLSLKFYPEDCDENWLNLNLANKLNYELKLDMQQGILSRNIEFCDKQGRKTQVFSRRIVSMAALHLSAIEYCFTPLNWSGNVIICSKLDASVTNLGVARYRELNSSHFDIVNQSKLTDDVALIAVQTKQSCLQVAQAIRTHLFCDNEILSIRPQTLIGKADLSQIFLVPVQKNQTIRVEKTAALYSSRDFASSGASSEAAKALQQASSFKVLEKNHRLAWKQLWRHHDVSIGKNNFEQQCIRLHIFHLLQSLSPNSIGLDCGAPARGLHGEAYRGHIFWDELFIIPFYTTQMPELARSLLMYRYRRLDAARQLAKKHGYKGAMYPWQSASNGEECSQQWHLNPKAQTWGTDYSSLQRHVNSAIVYNIWHYYQYSHDQDFLSQYGAVMILEIARFWASIAKLNPKTKRYEINGVMGPDEYHEKYPSSLKPGINNNAYTNIMAVWVLERALELFKILPKAIVADLEEALHLTRKEFARWKNITRKMFIPFHEGIISQFEGYELLRELSWQDYQVKYGNIERLDRILKSEGDSPDHYKLAKQADVLMLFYLFPFSTLQGLFQELGYQFTKSIKQKTIDYYLSRTTHGSTLSKVVISSIMANSNPNLSRELQLQALKSDIKDTQGGTTQEGVHLGVMAGTINYIIKHYAGIAITNNILSLSPCLPKDIPSISLHFCYRGNRYYMYINHHFCELTLITKTSPQLIKVLKKIVTMNYLESIRLAY
ncbi:MAG: trehalose 6-phosphate phosphorylase [Gammaproteobacteria bacterium]|jgi:trehalose/maltose hydrolase-like predicted phosphorylase|nr:trehalose 6-phosphate phosphorylase [Gammaproteobacteria bacterium]